MKNHKCLNLNIIHRSKNNERHTRTNTTTADNTVDYCSFDSATNKGYMADYTRLEKKK